MEAKVIQSLEEFQDVLNRDASFYLLKHSLTCPISARAKQEYDRYSLDTQIPMYTLYVQEARELSNTIADRYDVRHESPQALLFENNQVIWNTSHHDITENVLREQETRFNQ
ncbi:bacillithiol system redox-active protein YtxJ [Terribacillus saccharophilus]|uniref:bacillithiol system redox-active protein YtxJ n=1 Tax=Terribacillus saccharophilus TaxID=361277 RepID=UPI002989B329|nr:bacillithiol system redox-active protein YtxJ [Terribacillus saccharophilus]MCM3224105.1 bacillithiol system redox-active protein YtxJ [Terribacillus saccharophilus]